MKTADDFRKDQASRTPTHDFVGEVIDALAAAESKLEENYHAYVRGLIGAERADEVEYMQQLVDRLNAVEAENAQLRRIIEKRASGTDLLTEQLRRDLAAVKAERDDAVKHYNAWRGAVDISEHEGMRWKDRVETAERELARSTRDKKSLIHMIHGWISSAQCWEDAFVRAAKERDALRAANEALVKTAKALLDEKYELDGFLFDDLRTAVDAAIAVGKGEEK